jgi:hypothetical protein
MLPGLAGAGGSSAWQRTDRRARAQVRDVMVTGFVVAYLPVLAAATWAVHALWVVWAAKAAHNVWRLAGPPRARWPRHRRAGGWVGCEPACAPLVTRCPSASQHSAEQELEQCSKD